MDANADAEGRWVPNFGSWVPLAMRLHFLPGLGGHAGIQVLFGPASQSGKLCEMAIADYLR